MKSKLRSASSAVLLCGVVVAASSCGSDGESGSGEASVEEFCADVEALQNDESSDDDLQQEDIDQFRALAETAPSEIRGALETTVDGLAEALALGDDPENLEEYFEIVFSDEMVAAGIELEQFGVEQCGFPPADPNDDTIEMSELELDE